MTRGSVRASTSRPALIASALAATLAAALAACGGRTGPAVTARADDGSVAPVRAAIAQAWADHIAAARRRDSSAVSAIYAPDAVYAVADAPEVRGRPSLDSMEARGLATVEVVEAEHTTHALRVVGDEAYELGSVVGSVRPRGDTARVVAFHFMARWRRQPDGGWRLSFLVGR